METPKTEKKTTRTGKAIGQKKDRARVSIAINDADRTISTLWETIKKYYSEQKITAAEAARRVFLRGLTGEFEQITLARNAAAEAENDRKQGRLFE